MFGGALDRAGARRRPHRLPADAGRQPVRVQRQPGHRPRLARPHRGADRPGRHAGRGRPPADRARPRRRPSTWPSGPGADAFLLMALVNVLAADGLVDTGRGGRVPAPASTRCWPRPGRSPPRRWPGVTGVEADVIRRLAHDLAAAPTACVYGRIGTTTALFGTLTSWLVDVLNALTGNLDRPGGAMFTKAAAGAANTRGHARASAGASSSTAAAAGCGAWARRWASCRWPCLAEEIDTPGEGQIRALVTVAGNPVLSTPNVGPARRRPGHARLLRGRRPLRQRDDPPRRRDPAGARRALQKGHYDLALLQLAVRNVANYSPPVLPLDDGQLDEWEILARLALVAQGMGADADPAIVDDLVVRTLVDAAVGDETGPIARARPRRDPAPCWRAHRARAPARPHAAHRPLRRRLRRRSRRPDPRRAAGQPARHRPRPARAPAARRAAHAVGHGRAGARADRRRRRPPARRRSTTRPAG